tara:strand:+ start:7053 stop:7202 length:150 start_codon:yes stop_codon:yes gene_type:complete
MVLYTEQQLEDCYHEYRLMQVRQDMSFVTLNEFRELFEDLMHILYKDLL